MDFPSGPVVKNPPSNAGGRGSIPGQRTKILHTSGQLNPHAEALQQRSRVPELRPQAAK